MSVCNVNDMRTFLKEHGGELRISLRESDGAMVVEWFVELGGKPAAVRVLYSEESPMFANFGGEMTFALGDFARREGLCLT